jgi:3-isopropylmalate/(R)-2-methylmalate dehydratase small subunit
MPDLDTVVRARAWKFGDSVDTTQLAGFGLAGKTEAETLRINCLRGTRPEFTEQVQPGDILVAGTNFGCGSSRQTAVQALQQCGISVTLAESVARIHRRNSIALALPAFAVPGISELVSDGDIIEVDYPARVVRNVSTGAGLTLPELPASVVAVYRAGGISQVILEKLAERGIVPAPA